MSDIQNPRGFDESLQLLPLEAPAGRRRKTPFRRPSVMQMKFLPDLEVVPDLNVISVGARLRQVDRAVMRFLDMKLEMTRLTAAQLWILGTLRARSSPSISELADRLALERSTVSRNLRLLERKRFVERSRDERRRARAVTITAEGRARLLVAIPAWTAGQQELMDRLGSERWSSLQEIASILQRYTVASVRQVQPRRGP